MKHVGLLLGCLILITASALQATAQSRNRAVVPQIVADPIKVTTPTINTRKGRSAGGWISQPLVQVENISSKPITYFMIEATLPGVKAPFMLAYGQIPGKQPTSNVNPLQPGAKIDLSVDHHACEWVKKRLIETDTRTLTGNHATARINGVVFNDQTAWFDGLPHVMEANNPLRWKVVRSTAALSDLNSSPIFSFLKAGYRESNSLTPRPQMCWDRLGTEYVDCCGFQMPSAILIQMWGGIFEPFPMQSECDPGVYCEWTKALGCSS